MRRTGAPGPSLEAWAKWTAQKEAEDARSGFDAADRAFSVARDDLASVAAQLAVTRALTVDGLLAKARAFGQFSYIDNLAEILKQQIDESNALDREVLALSLMRDVIMLAQGGEATVAMSAYLAQRGALAA
jgi:hypothetical protein